MYFYLCKWSKSNYNRKLFSTIIKKRGRNSSCRILIFFIAHIRPVSLAITTPPQAILILTDFFCQNLVGETISLRKGRKKCSCSPISRRHFGPTKQWNGKLIDYFCELSWKVSDVYFGQSNDPRTFIGMPSADWIEQ